jgi:hypothetical protein
MFISFRHKSPLFTSINESISSLTQIKLYSSLEKHLKLFRILINNSSRSNFTFWLVANVFEAYTYYISILGFIVILIFGISQVDKSNSGEYMLSVVFMIQVNDQFTFFLRQLTIIESNMVSF